jgi:hypothetical protein
MGNFTREMYRKNVNREMKHDMWANKRIAFAAPVTP